MRTLTMEKIDLQKLCGECGVFYKKHARNEEIGYYGGLVILKYDPKDILPEYKNYIFVMSDAEWNGNHIYFLKAKKVYNDEYNIDFLKKTLTNTIIKYKQIKQEQKEKKIQKDFE